MTLVGAASSGHPLVTHAVGETVGRLLEVGGTGPDLVSVFTTAPLVGVLDDVVAAVSRLLRPRSLIGATAASVLGHHRELGNGPGIAVLAVWSGGGAHGGAAPTPVRIDTVPVAGGSAVAGIEPLEGADGTFVLLTDPFTCPAGPVVAALRERAPELSVLGAGASAARGPGGNRLLLDGSIHDHGAVGLHLARSMPVEVLVSQGCRPVGAPFAVTAADSARITGLAGRSALERLRDTVGSVDDAERALMADSLLIGHLIDRPPDGPGRGEVLVHRVLGADPERGGLAVSGTIPLGAVVQFQVRDATSASEDLRAVLDGRSAAGALCFTDVVRTSSVFGGPHHDVDAVSAVSRGAAVAGMSAAGTVSSVNGRAALHDGATAVLLIDPRRGA